MEKIFVYIGTYTSEGGEGIYIYRFDPETGKLEKTGKTTGLMNPSFLTIDSRQRYLYAVNEVSSFAGKRVGGVSSFLINEKNGELTFLNSKPSGGTGPCYVTLDKMDRYLLVANYGSGSVCVLPINDDGSLGNPTDLIQHEGSSINPKRQEGPHAHSVVVGPSNRYVYVPDLGLDKIMIYRFDSNQGKLTPNKIPYVSTKPGAGPRHFIFHPNNRLAYLINELDSTIVAYAYNEHDGSLKEIQTISTLPKNFTGVNIAADIHVTPSGKFLYGSNRGHDSLVIYQINEETGMLNYVGHEHTRGSFPRNFAIDPFGKFLLVANRKGNNIVSFRINAETGLLKPTGHEIPIASPACIKFAVLT